MPENVWPSSILTTILNLSRPVSRHEYINLSRKCGFSSHAPHRGWSHARRRPAHPARVPDHTAYRRLCQESPILAKFPPLFVEPAVPGRPARSVSVSGERNPLGNYPKPPKKTRPAGRGPPVWSTDSRPNPEIRKFSTNRCFLHHLSIPRSDNQKAFGARERQRKLLPLKKALSRCIHNV